MSQGEAAEVIARSSLFRGFSPEQIAAVAALARRRELAPREEVVREGEPATELLLIASGAVEVVKAYSNHSEHRLAELGAGDSVGEFALLDNSARSASIRAVAATRLFAIDIAALRELASENGSRGTLYENLSAKLGERILHGNEFSVQALEREVEYQRERASIGKFLIYVIVVLSLYTYALSAIDSLLDPGQGATLVTVPLLLFVVVFAIFGIRTLHYPLEFYGITLLGWRRSLAESLLVTVPILGLILLAKWLFVRYVPAYQDLPLFFPFSPIRKMHSELFTPIQLWLLTATLYCLHTPVQELLVRGFLQSPMQSFLTGKHRYLLAILVSNLIFSAFHLTNSLLLATSAFVPGLLWGWLYLRHKTLIGVSVSHILIGLWMAFIVGFGTG